MPLRQQSLIAGALILAVGCSSDKPAAMSDTNTAVVAASAPAKNADGIVESDLDPRQRTELLAFRDSVWKAWFAGDTAFLMRALPADFMSIPAGDDTTWAGRDLTVEKSREFVANGGKLLRLEFPRNTILSSGNTTVVLTKYLMELEVGGQRVTSSGRATEVFVRKNGRWIHPSWHLDSGK